MVASNPYLDCRQVFLKHCIYHLIEADEWEAIELLLTDLKFVEAMSVAGLAYELQDAFVRALDRWPKHERWALFSAPPPDPSPRWLQECIEEILAGGVTAHLDRGCGPVLLSLYAISDEEREAVGRNEEFSEARLDDCFGADRGASETLLRSFGRDSDDEGPHALSSVELIEAFGEFVASHVQQLASMPWETIPMARNSAEDGPVVNAANCLLDDVAHPWFTRDPREPVVQRPLVLRTLSGHTDTIYAVGISSDGRRAVSGGADSLLRVWDVVSGQCVHEVEGHRAEIKGLAMSPDGRRAVSYSSGEDIGFRIWDLDSGQCLGSSLGNQSRIDGIAISADCGLSVTVHGDGCLRVWNAHTGECVRTIKDDAHSASNFVSLTSDGRLAVTAGQRRGEAVPCPNKVVVWDLRNGKKLRVLSGHRHLVTRVVVTADGRLAISGDFVNTLRVWEVRTGTCLATFGVPVRDWTIRRTDGIGGKPTDSISGLAVTPDGRLLLACCEFSRNVWLQDVRAGAVQPLRGQATSAHGVAVSDDGRVGISCSGASLFVWNIATGSVGKSLLSHSGPVGTISLSTDNKWAYSSGWRDQEDEVVHVWRMSPADYHTTLTGFSKHVAEIAGVAEGKMAVLAARQKITFWNFDAGRVLNLAFGQDRLLERLCLTPDESMAISAECDNTAGTSRNSALRIWSIHSARCLRTIDLDMRELKDLQVSCDGRLAFVGGGVNSDFSVTVWDVATGSPCGRMELPAPISSFAVSPDDCVLGTCDWELSIRLWDLRTGHQLKTMWGHQDLISDMRFMPDGLGCITASRDGTVRVWDIQQGTCRDELRGHDGPVMAIRVSSGGRYVVSAGHDRTLRVWDMSRNTCGIYPLGDSFAEGDMDDQCRRRLSELTGGGQIVCGTTAGKLHFLKLAGVELETSWVTAIRIFRYEVPDLPEQNDMPRTEPTYGASDTLPGLYDPESSTVCPLCMVRFSVDETIVQAILEIGGSPHAELPPSLNLRASHWDDARLKWMCPNCNHNLRFTPFIFVPMVSGADTTRTTGELSLIPAEDVGNGSCAAVDNDVATRTDDPIATCVICGGDCEGILCPQQETLCVGSDCLRDAMDSANAEWCNFRRKEGCPRCIFCGEQSRTNAHLFTCEGWLCGVCIEKLLKESCTDSEIEAWSVLFVSESLAAEAPLRNRMLVLLAFERWLARMSGEGCSADEQLCRSLIEHLGYDKHLFWSESIRRVALEACISVGPNILPALTSRAKSCRQLSWKFFSNVVTAAICVAPNQAEVQSLVEFAIQDSEAEVRRRVVSALSPLTSRWVGAILQRLAKDPVEHIRWAVRNAYKTWEKAQPRLPREDIELEQETSSADVEPPASGHLQALPRSASVAFAGRCGLHLQANYMAWPNAPKEHFGWLHRANVFVLHLCAARGEVGEDDFLTGCVKEALEDAKDAAEDARISGDATSFRHAASAATAAKGLLEVLGAATSADSFVTALWAANAAKAAIDSTLPAEKEPLTRVLWSYYEKLKVASARESWSDATGVPKDFFGPDPLESEW